MTTNFGFLATNGSSQVLISSKTKNLHFLGKATLYSTIESDDRWGGRRRWAFRLDCSTIPVPFFSVPTSDKYAIVRMTLVSGITWEVEILRSGTSSSIPEVYMFTEVNTQMKPVGSWGMKVLNETAGITYDSRLKPLIVRGNTSVIPPYDPIQSLPGKGSFDARYCRTNTTNLLAPDNTNSTVVYNTSVSKPIVSYQSISQTMREVSNKDQQKDCAIGSIFGYCIVFAEYTYFFSGYWAFYRAGLSVVQSGAHSYLTCGWVTVNASCRAEAPKESTFLGINYDSYNYTAGQWPFSNATINLNSVPVIIADGALYD